MNYLNKNSKKILLTILAFFLVGTFWRFSTILYFPHAGGFLEKDQTIKLQPGETLRQIFSSDSPDLAKVEIILRSPGINPGDRAEAELLDASCQKVLRQGTLADSFLSSNNLYEFSFPALSDSKNQNYCLQLTFKPQKKSAHALQFFYRSQEGAQFQNLSTGETFSGNTLSFRLVSKNPSLWVNLVELDQRISQYKPGFMKGLSLAIICAGFVVISLFFLVSLILL